MAPHRRGYFLTAEDAEVLAEDAEGKCFSKSALCENLCVLCDKKSLNPIAK
jgi:hypothetical protein